MISRIWHGWTSLGNADAYEALLKSEIFVGIRDRQIVGFRGIQLFQRNLGVEVEFITVMWFDSLDAVRAFAGKITKSLWCCRRREPCSHGSMRARSTMRCEQRSTVSSRSVAHPPLHQIKVWHGALPPAPCR